MAAEALQEKLSVEAAHLDPGAAARLLEEHGCVLIRRAFRKLDIFDLQERARAFYAFRDAQQAEGALPADYERYLYRFGHIHMQEVDRPGEPAGIVIRRIAQSVLPAVLRAYLGDDVSFLLNNCLLRRQRVDDGVRHVPFHQDAGFLGADMRVVNCWIPLDPCGVDAPGIEVVTEGALDLLPVVPPTGTDNEIYDVIDLSEGRIVEIFGAHKLWHPEMDVGDALLFSSLTIHRTHVTPAMAKERISLEVRALAGDVPARLAGTPLAPLTLRHPARR